MCSGDSRHWLTSMAVFPCGMLQAAVSYPVSESFMVLTHLVLPGVFYWSQNLSSPPIFCLCLSICKLLILLPCKPLLAHESIPSLVPLVPLREIHGLSCCPFQRGGSTSVSLQNSAFVCLGCVVLWQCVSSGVFECSLWTHRSPWSMAGTSGSRSVDSRDNPLYKSLCLGWKIKQAPQVEKHCL